MDREMRGRVRLLLYGVLVISVCIGAKLVHLQVFLREDLRARALGQHRREVEVPATRGSVLDRNGQELALSLKTESLFAHPRRVKHAESAASKLAPIIGVSRRQILSRLQSGKPFVYLQRFLEPEQVAAVRALDLPVGESKPFGFLPSSKRYYPRGKLGVHVVGFAGIDGEGVEGIEKQFDRELQGDPTVYLIAQDGLAGRVRQSLIREPKKKPQDVILTLDLVVQHIAERELGRAVEATGARSASVIVLDPATGQILALANLPTTDANRYPQAEPQARINRAVVHQYEPGSTFKMVPMAAALEDDRVYPEQRFDCEQGRYLYRGRPIRDSTPHGILTAREILERSSNIGMVKITKAVKSRSLRETILSFGFGSKTGIELPGELSGGIKPLNRWSKQTQPSLAFGYEISVTAMQMAQAMSIIANDGVQAPLRLTLGLRDADGRVHRFDPPRTRRVISHETNLELVEMLEGVIMRGTGTRARVQGYRLAGKSGTAKKVVDGAYSSTDYVASFGGFGPVESPQLVTFVVIDTPRGGEYYGGKVAAPVFQRIMEDALSYLRVPADDDNLVLTGSIAAVVDRDDRSALR